MYLSEGTRPSSGSGRSMQTSGSGGQCSNQLWPVPPHPALGSHYTLSRRHGASALHPVTISTQHHHEPDILRGPDLHAGHHTHVFHRRSVSATPVLVVQISITTNITLKTVYIAMGSNAFHFKTGFPGLTATGAVTNFSQQSGKDMH